jgi:hypothetical protein
VQLAIDVSASSTSNGKRSSARLAAKKKMKIGRNRNAIVKAQEILVAKLNNSASKHFQSSNALNSNNQVDLFEQLERHFTRPLTKEQMEAIMEGLLLRNKWRQLWSWQIRERKRKGPRRRAARRHLSRLLSSRLLRGSELFL